MPSNPLKPFLAGVATTAAAGALLLGLVGFQGGASAKVGVVDFPRALKESALIATQNEGLRKADSARQAVAEFVNTYPTITVDQARTFRTLSLKANPTDADREALDKLKAAIIADEKKARDLQTKANPTQDDLKAIEAYRTRAVASREMLQGWIGEFRNEMGALRNDAEQDLAQKVRALVAEVGKKQGYSVIYNSDVAPYAANDVTADVQAAAARLR